MILLTEVTKYYLNLYFIKLKQNTHNKLIRSARVISCITHIYTISPPQPPYKNLLNAPINSGSADNISHKILNN